MNWGDQLHRETLISARFFSQGHRVGFVLGLIYGIGIGWLLFGGGA
jgi:tetrahydromethanopterin S-methyltransferase subunit G